MAVVAGAARTRPTKRERTRQALLRSAVEVIAAKGLAETRITDVTDHSGVSNGTFYNYFVDKDELVRAVAVEVVGGMAQALDTGMREETDAVRRVVLATTGAIDQAIGEADVGVVLFELLERLPDVRENVLGFLRRDLELGVVQGSFDVVVTPFLLDQVLALIVISVRVQAREGADADKTRQTCENVLRLCGLTPSVARRAVAATRADEAFPKP